MSHTRIRISIALVLVGIALAMVGTSLRAQYHHQAFEQRVELGLWAANAGVWFWDMDSGELTWDARMYEIFGMPGSWTPSYEGFLELMHPEDRNQVNLRESLKAKSREISYYRLVETAEHPAKTLVIFSGVSADGRYAGGICIPLEDETPEWFENGLKNAGSNPLRVETPRQAPLHMIR